jgi:AAA15 family ATPase/GTPase
MNDLRRLHPSWLLGVPDDELTSQQKKLIVRFRKLLRESDFGVTDFQKIQKEDKGIGNGRTEIALLHGDNDTGAWLPLEEESSGTQTMFRLAPFVLDALQRGGLLVADELEASLHPLLAIELIRLFSSSSTNPKGAQLLFTTHDSNLLGNITGTSPLRRDQIYFAEKKPDGKSVIYPLTNFRPRKSENIERGYLQGRYGAIPYLARFGEVAE